MTRPEHIFSSRDVARIAQISPRQLQWWDERKLVSPCKRQHRRLYHAHEVIEITVIAVLRRKGLSLQKARQILPFLQRAIGPRLRKQTRVKSELHFLTDGKSSYLEEHPRRIIDLLKEARHPMYLVCVSDYLKHLDSIPGSRRLF